jgi:hypothetical protein
MQIRTKLTHTACSPTLTFSAFSENNFQNSYIFVLYYISLVTFNYVPFENHFISTVWVENTNIKLESVQVFYRLITYVLPLKFQLSKGRVGIPLCGLTLPPFCPCPKPGPGFPVSHVVVFNMISELKWKLIFLFVDNGGIIDHHCLNILFINNYLPNVKKNIKISVSAHI